MLQRLPPPEIIDMREVRAEVRRRENAARDEAVLYAGALAQEQAIRDALNPKGGWWRARIRGRALTALRCSAVIDALAVGATPVQIAEASGASLKQVHGARLHAKRYPAFLRKEDGLSRRATEWPQIIRDAIADGLSQRALGEREGVSGSWVSELSKRHAIEWPKRRNSAP